MSSSGYKQFCPVAMASEILCERWTMVLIRELLAGSSRFNDLRRGVPRMSPALLSKRLKELESAQIIRRSPVPGEPGISEYRLTEAGQELGPVVNAIGWWGQRWISTEAALGNLDPTLLMWDIRRNLTPSPRPSSRVTIAVLFSDLPERHRRWWLVVEPGEEPDLCWTDPGFEVDLYLSTDLRTLTEIWMGHSTMARAQERSRLLVTGSRRAEIDLGRWLALSPFAKVERGAGLAA